MNKNKRRVVKALSVSGIVGTSIPDQWIRPVVQHVVLPAHGQTSEVASDNDNASGPDFVALTSQCDNAPDNQFHRVTFENDPPLPGDTYTITPLASPVPLPPADGIVIYATHPTGVFRAVLRSSFSSAAFGFFCTFSGTPVTLTQQFRITNSISADVTFMYSGTTGGPYQIVVSDITILP